MIDDALKKLLKRKRIPLRCYIGKSVDGDEVYTSQGTIIDVLTRPRFADVNAGPTPGRDETGHRLPASSTRDE